MISFNHTAFHAKKFKKAVLQNISSIITSGIFLNGKTVREFEKKLSVFFKKGYCTTTASGHDSLILALQSLNLQKGDEVLFPANALPSAFPIFIAGFHGVPVDVDEQGQMNPDELEKKITKKTKAIIVVHLYGMVGCLDEIMEIVKKQNLFLIEDCAQAFGTTFKNQPVGTWGDIGCFSFYPTKNLGTLGDGGALWTKHKRVYQYFLKAKSYGETSKYFSEFIAGHSRLPDIQAGILDVYLQHFPKDAQLRKKIFRQYQDALKKYSMYRYIDIISSHKDSDPVPHLFVIKTKNRDGLKAHLQKKGIETFIHYPHPVHVLPAFSFLKYKIGNFPVVEHLAKHIISLPFHQYLKKKDIDFIAKTIAAYYTS